MKPTPRPGDPLRATSSAGRPPWRSDLPPATPLPGMPLPARLPALLRKRSRARADGDLRFRVQAVRERKGFTFVEVILAVVVVAAVLGGLLGWLQQTTGDAGRSIHYLRAFELGQEMLDWVLSTPLDEARRKALERLGGSLVDAQTGRSRPVPAGSTRDWPVGPQELAYPADYAPCFFHRHLRIEPVAGRPTLFEVTVEVSWNEGRPPATIESVGGTPDRMRRIVLSTLVHDGSPTR
ncbi:MAG: prepilin-type N-terminal cleavage/methylation domain-containing protein [Candidatus Riflebacteria bacterium]|nr:prepilin-type N-terminal cleavage/methylation domain-containing protein [Candidatus Riflebacteria bacterium]